MITFYPDKREWVKLDQFKRYQKSLSVQNLFPNLKNGLCGCGCEQKLPKGKSRWASKDCMDSAITYFWIIKGDTQRIRREVFKRDAGACRMCGLITEDWQADHIIAVVNGGGACGLDNFQTLCTDCHKEKTKSDLK